jgi:rhomboid protease GluP
MGSRLDSWVTSPFPEKAKKNPSTYLLAFFSSLPFILVFLKVGPSSLSSIPSYTMTQIGATNSALILMDQYWRFVTANFVHFNALHLLMNLLGLFALGPLIEEMFDYKKCFFIFFISGTLTFAIFFVLTLIFPHSLMSGLAGGASAGIFGLLGAGVLGAKKTQNNSGLHKILMQNFFQNLILGLIILPLGSTLLHVMGFGLGFFIASFISIGSKAEIKNKKIFSYLFFLSLLSIIFCFTLQGYELKKFPIFIEKESFKTNLYECISTDENKTSIGMNDLTQKMKNCELVLRMGVNHPDKIVARIIELAENTQNSINKEKYVLYYKRINSLLKPRP